MNRSRMNEREPGRRPAAPGERGLGRHSTAAFRAAMAGLHALPHPLEAFAARRARAADLSAFAAEMGIVGGIAGHEVERGLTDFGAIEHQRHMLGIGMITAHLQTVGHGHRQAADMAIMAGVDTGPHVGTHLMGHVAFLSSFPSRLIRNTRQRLRSLGQMRVPRERFDQRISSTDEQMDVRPLTLTRCQTLHERALVGATR